MVSRRLGMVAMLVACGGVLAGALGAAGVGGGAKVGAAAERKAIKALLICGGCCHDYAAQKKILSEGIGKLANVEWTLIQEGGTGKDFINPRFNDPDWAKPYDVVVHDACFADVKDAEYIRKVIKPHFEGKAAVVLHCAMHTFRDAPNVEEYREFLGVSTHEHEASTILEIKPMADQVKHPIMMGFPEVFKTPVNDELYVILKRWPKMTPLAQAYGKAHKADYPCIWINEYGKGRVFGTTLGHDTAMVKTETYVNLVGRGLLWACGKLGEDGKVVAGYEAVK